MRRTDPQVPDSAGPIRLISNLRHDHLSSPRPRGRCRSASTAVVNDSSHSREQRLLVDLTDDETIVAAIDERKLGPATRDENAPTVLAYDIDGRARKVRWCGKASEAYVHRRFTGVQKCL